MSAARTDCGGLLFSLCGLALRCSSGNVNDLGDINPSSMIIGQHGFHRSTGAHVLDLGDTGYSLPGRDHGGGDLYYMYVTVGAMRPVEDGRPVDVFTSCAEWPLMLPTFARDTEAAGPLGPASASAPPLSALPLSLGRTRVPQGRNPVPRASRPRARMAVAWLLHEASACVPAYTSSDVYACACVPAYLNFGSEY